MNNEYLKLYKKKRIIEHFNTNNTILKQVKDVANWNCNLNSYNLIYNDGKNDKDFLKYSWNELIKGNYHIGNKSNFPALFIKERYLDGRQKEAALVKCREGNTSISPFTDYPNNYDMWIVKPALSDESEDGLITKCNPNTHYESKKADPPLDTVCTPYTSVADANCSHDQYLDTPYTNKDRECKPLTKCTSNEYISKINTPTTDVVCTPYSTINKPICKKNQYLDAGGTNRDRECKPFTTCTSEQYEIKKPDPSSNRECINLIEWKNRVLQRKSGKHDSGNDWNSRVINYTEIINDQKLNEKEFLKVCWNKLIKKGYHVSNINTPTFPAIFIKKRNYTGVQYANITKCESGNTNIGLFSSYPYNWDMYILKQKLTGESVDGLITKCNSNQYEKTKADPPKDTTCLNCKSCNGKFKKKCSKYDDAECCTIDPNSTFNNKDEMNCNWTCNDGYYKNGNICNKCTVCGDNNSELLEKCTPEKDSLCKDCPKPPNSSYKSKTGCDWNCDNEYSKDNRYSKAGDKCVKCNLPINATYKSDKSCEFECDNRHELINGECITCNKPVNSTFTDTTGCNWKCNDRTNETDNECIGCNLPDNATYTNDIGCEFECNNRFSKKDGECVSCDVPNSTYASNIGCEFECNNRFYQKDKKCVSCYLPENATYKNSIGCEYKCNNRFYEKDKNCVSCNLPSNATYTSDIGCEWKCNNRFFEKDNKCSACIKPENSTYTDDTSCEWHCNNRFYEKDDNCVSCKLPDNALFSKDTGCEWECNNRYYKKDNKCINCDLPENSTYINDTGCEWKCDKQFYNRDNKYCLSCELPNNASYENDSNCKWKCNDGFYRNYDKCIKCSEKCPDYYNLKEECSTEKDIICEPCKKPENGFFISEKDCDWRCNDGFYHKNGKCTTMQIELKNKVLNNKENLMKIIAFVIIFIVYLFIKNNISNIISSMSSYYIIIIELLVVGIIIKVYVLGTDKNKNATKTPQNIK